MTVTKKLTLMVLSALVGIGSGGRPSRRARMVEELSPLHWTHSRLHRFDSVNSSWRGQAGSGSSWRAPANSSKATTSQ